MQSESLHVTRSFKFWVNVTNFLGIPECRRNKRSTWWQLRALRTTTEEMVCWFMFGLSDNQLKLFFWCAVRCLACSLLFCVQSNGAYGFPMNEAFHICYHANVLYAVLRNTWGEFDSSKRSQLNVLCFIHLLCSLTLMIWFEEGWLCGRSILLMHRIKKDWEYSSNKIMNMKLMANVRDSWRYKRELSSR